MPSFTATLFAIMLQAVNIDEQPVDGIFPVRGKFEEFYERFSQGKPGRPNEKEQLKLLFERVWYCQDEQKRAAEGIKNPIAKGDRRLGKVEEVEAVCIAYSIGASDAAKIFRDLQIKHLSSPDTDADRTDNLQR